MGSPTRQAPSSGPGLNGKQSEDGSTLAVGRTKSACFSFPGGVAFTRSRGARAVVNPGRALLAVALVCSRGAPPRVRGSVGQRSPPAFLKDSSDLPQGTSPEAWVLGETGEGGGSGQAGPREWHHVWGGETLCAWAGG